MGLRETRIINEVHPWLGVRLRWLGEVARIFGGAQLLTSGVRTAEKQLQLYNDVRGRPVAFPGCSQHQYGFAADAVWQPFVGVTSKGRMKVTTFKETVRAMEGFARQVQLTLVAGDTGHMQIYPASVFKPWAVSIGACNPNPPPPRLRRTELLCGPGARSAGIDALGRVLCRDPFDDILTG